MRGRVLFIENPTPDQLKEGEIRLKQLNDMLTNGIPIIHSKDVEDYFLWYNTIFNDRVELVQSSCHTCVKKMNRTINELFSRQVKEDNPNVRKKGSR